MSAEEQEDLSDTWFSRRLDAGLFRLQVRTPQSPLLPPLLTAQTIDVILAWLIAEDDGAKSRIQEIFADRDEDLSLVKATLEGNTSDPRKKKKVSSQR